MNRALGAIAEDLRTACQNCFSGGNHDFAATLADSPAAGQRPAQHDHVVEEQLRRTAKANRRERHVRNPQISDGSQPCVHANRLIAQRINLTPHDGAAIELADGLGSLRFRALAGGNVNSGKSAIDPLARRRHLGRKPQRRDCHAIISRTRLLQLISARDVIPLAWVYCRTVAGP
jgi:hypothetical protein